MDVNILQPNCDGEKPLSPLCGALYHGNLAKLITLSGSLCMLCVIFFLRSLVSLLFLFSLTGLKERLQSSGSLTRCLFGLLV